VGVDVQKVEIETVLGSGFSGLNILGLNSETTRDLRERVRSALESIGISIPARRVVVNITPSEKIKLSRTPLAQLDFAVAAAIIYGLHEEKEGKQIPLYKPEKEYFAGELSLAGEIKKLSNTLIYQSILHQSHHSLTTLCLPADTLQDPHFVPRPETQFFVHLKDWYQQRKKSSENQRVTKTSIYFDSEKDSQSLRDMEISSQKEKILDSLNLLIKNPKLCVALLVSALGSHHILVAGEPGVGKSFALQRISNFLSPLTSRQSLEVKLIHSSSEHFTRPFRSPHHSATPAALVGGSSLKPGEVSLAHHGVLFLDELAEFTRPSLESLREPLDSGEVFLSRAGGSIRYPAAFQLCATTNPCSCGYLFSRQKPCRCNPNESRKYLQKISGPLLDRFCLQVWVEPRHEENENLDLFAQHLEQEFQAGKLPNFVDHFLKEQTLLKEEDLASFKENFYKKNSFQSLFCKGLSVRGQEKIVQLAFTFQRLFPSLFEQPQFFEDLLTYRILDKMLLQRHLF
jgi:magnesium chelatase family protein